MCIITQWHQSLSLTCKQPAQQIQEVATQELRFHFDSAMIIQQDLEHPCVDFTASNTLLFLILQNLSELFKKAGQKHLTLATTVPLR